MNNLKTVFNGTEAKNLPSTNMNKNLLGRRNPYSIKPDSLLSRMKKGFGIARDYKDSYENMGIPGLLGHYLETKGKIGTGNLKMDFPNMSARYQRPGNPWSVSAKARPKGGSIGIDYEF